MSTTPEFELPTRRCKFRDRDEARAEVELMYEYLVEHGEATADELRNLGRKRRAGGFYYLNAFPTLRTAPNVKSLQLWTVDDETALDSSHLRNVVNDRISKHTKAANLKRKWLRGAYHVLRDDGARNYRVLRADARREANCRPSNEWEQRTGRRELRRLEGVQEPDEDRDVDFVYREE